MCKSIVSVLDTISTLGGVREGLEGSKQAFDVV